MLAEIEEGLGDESECGDFDEERGGPDVMAACDFHSLSAGEEDFRSLHETQIS